MKNKKQLQKYFNSKYFNKNNNYRAILSEIRKEEKMNKNNIFKIIATTIITLLGTTGIVFASSKIYNEYVKKQDVIDSSDIFLEGTNENGSFYSFNITNEMTYDEKTNLCYKVITNIQDYSLFKSKENELPEMAEENFEQNSIIIIVNPGNLRQVCEADLTISEINCDDQTTYITMKQNENPDYDAQHQIWYAIIDNTILKENIEIKIEYSNIANPNFVSLDSLPDDYSIEDALKDGCFVEKDYKVLSDNKYAIDELIEKAQNGEESSIRIFSQNGDFIRVIDLSYKDNIFVLNCIDSDNDEIKVRSGKYLSKEHFTKENSADQYDYCLKDYNIPNYFGQTILTINSD